MKSSNGKLLDYLKYSIATIVPAIGDCHRQIAEMTGVSLGQFVPALPALGCDCRNSFSPMQMISS
jgi:hypothetical protein